MLVVACAIPVHAANPDKLWQIVSQECLPNQAANGNPAPCKLIDKEGNYAILKDISGVAQYLLIPTTRVSGIEAKELLHADAPGYFDSAWRQRQLVEQKLGRPLPRSRLSVEINSAVSRSQLQLHLHIDCLRADIPAVLAAYEGLAPDVWFPITINGQRHEVMRLIGSELGKRNPFQLASRISPTAPEMMGALSLLLAGATFSDGQQGFYLVANAVNFDTGVRGEAEVLQDHSCK
jgi:CDP-diacylglycerol pyrophosphatase